MKQVKESDTYKAKFIEQNYVMPKKCKHENISKAQGRSIIITYCFIFCMYFISHQYLTNETCRTKQQVIKIIST